MANSYSYLAGDVRDHDLGTEQYDLIILGQGLHSLGEESARSLLKRVLAALRRPGIVLISETMPTDDRTGPLFQLLFGLSMLLLTEHSDAFTSGEYRQWLSEAGFHHIEPLFENSSSLLVAQK